MMRATPAWLGNPSSPPEIALIATVSEAESVYPLFGGAAQENTRRSRAVHACDVIFERRRTDGIGQQGFQVATTRTGSMPEVSLRCSPNRVPGQAQRQKVNPGEPTATRSAAAASSLRRNSNPNIESAADGGSLPVRASKRSQPQSLINPAGSTERTSRSASAKQPASAPCGEVLQRDAPVLPVTVIILQRSNSRSCTGTAPRWRSYPPPPPRNQANCRGKSVKNTRRAGS